MSLKVAPLELSFYILLTSINRSPLQGFLCNLRIRNMHRVQITNFIHLDKVCFILNPQPGLSGNPFLRGLAFY